MPSSLSIDAFRETMKFEGGYGLVAGDRGGETYRGISRKFFPNWDGWALVDQAKARGVVHQGSIISDQHLDNLVFSFYSTTFFMNPQFYRLDDKICGYVFDFAVNSGAMTAIKHLQEVANKLGAVCQVDGRLGPATATAIGSLDQDEVRDGLIQSRIQYLRAIVQNDESQEKFLAGWLNRAKNYAS